MSSPRPTIYLDYNATTPCDPRVIEAMLPYFYEHPANPSNTLHAEGRRAARAVEDARAQVAELIGAQPEEIIFTGGGTESNNLAILGTARGNASGPRRKIVVSAIEHKAVLGPAEQLTREGLEVVKLPVDRQGTVDLDVAAEIIDTETLLVSIHWANNEVGTVQRVAAIAQLASRAGALFHTDAVQAIGRIPVRLGRLKVDLLSMSSHKLYGPKGVGALYVRGAGREFQLAPILWGSIQEGGKRPGTENVPGIVGFGTACAMADAALEAEARRTTALRDAFETALQEAVPEVQINSQDAPRLPGTSSLTFPGCQADALVLNAQEIAISTGAACNSGALEPSHVLMAMALSREEAWATVRVSWGRFNTSSDVDTAVLALRRSYTHVREDSAPLCTSA